MTIDVSAFVGPYPFRRVPASDAASLVRSMDHIRVATAWVGHLGAFLYNDPRDANADLREWLAPYRDRLTAIPTVHPGLPHWEEDLADAAEAGAPGVRVYPNWQGVDPVGAPMRALVTRAAELRLAVLLTVRFEDGRQRHPLDVAADLPAASVRALARVHPGARLLVTHADRAFVEEVHFGLTSEESRRVLWEIGWIWGPPEDHLALLLRTVGRARFTFGSGMPLRIPESTPAKLDLLALDAQARAALEHRNLAAWRAV